MSIGKIGQYGYPQVKRLFKSVNGFLIPGGGQPLKPGFPFFDTATLMLDLVKEANDKGDYFPVRPHCST